MPLYEYECEDCGERFEKLTSASKKDEASECPECGSANTGRVLSTFAVGKASSSSGSSCPTGTCPLM